MRKIYHDNHGIWIRALATVAVSFFLINNIVWGYSDGGSSKFTLAVQSIFHPIIDTIGVQHQKQIEFELNVIIAMALKGKNFLDINSALDKRCAENEEVAERALEVVDIPRTLDDTPEKPIVIRVKTTAAKGTQKYFRILFRGNNLSDMFDGNKISVEAINPQPLPSSERAWAVDYIRKKISELPSDEKGNLIRNSWQAIINNPAHPVFTTISILTLEGVKRSTLTRLIDVLFGLGIDVSNPWTSSYHISDIIGYMSSELLGEDLSRFKSKIRTINFTDIRPAEHFDVIQDSSYDYTESLAVLRKEYYALRDKQEKIICSKNSFLFIHSKVNTSSNIFIEHAVRTLLPIIWKELDIPPDSPAVLYFRNMKSFASDLDLFYWGPKREEVNLKLTELFFLLGIKRDLFTTYLITTEIENGNIDFDVYHYFFSGKSIEINNASFEEFYKTYVESRADRDRMWQNVYPYMCRQLAILNNKGPATLPLDRRDFKKLLFRGVTNLLFGLSKKFNINFGTDETSFLVSLNKHLEKDEMVAIVEMLRLTSQTRNLYQIITRRRWETDINEKTMKKVEDVIAYQGVPQLKEKNEELGARLEKIRAKYFGLPEFHETKYLPLLIDERAKAAWQKTAQAYHDIIEKRIAVGQAEAVKSENISISSQSLLLNRISKYLGEYPVDETIDLSLIPKEDLEQNMETWAYIIALNNNYGIDANYIFKSDDEAYKTEAKRILFTKIEQIKHIDTAEIKARVTDMPRPGALQVNIIRKEYLEKLKNIPENALLVAMSEGDTLEGIPLRDFISASAIGLAQAALKKIQTEKDPHLSEIIKQEILPRMQHIYQKLFPDRDIKEIVTEETILNMIDDNPIVRKNLAIALALPPIVRVAIQYLKDYHDRIHLLQQSA